MKWPYANSGWPFFLGFSSLLSALPAKRRQVLALVSLRVLTAGQGAETDGTNQPPGPVKLSLQDLVKVEVPKVYGASKREEPSTEAPASVTVIQADEIQKYGWRKTKKQQKQQ